ncbi:hypothetical protein TELCIR_01275, partial [Teladorsagia circumcincta]
IYNQRRRLRALGLDPDTPKGQFIDNEAIREHIKMANAKKAEAARLRYHRMTAEERREYNQRRTESFRKRRVEEEILLSTPAGRISAEALQKAQQIMIRNARKAEAARARYQKMTPEQRKEYNMRRAQAKKLRALGRGGAMSSDCSIDGSITDSSGLSSSFQHNSAVSLLESGDMSSSQEHLNSSNPQVTQTTDDIFEQMEREVIKRTKQAHMALARQQQQSQTNRFSSVDHQLIEGDQVLLTNDGQLVDDKVYVQARQRDEELCHLAETCQLDTLDEETRRAIAEAQMRRARRAEQARAKYHRMNSEERRQYNAMRDAQRRQRKRAQEEARQRAQLNEVLSTETGLSPHSLSPSVNESISPSGHGLSPSGAEPGQIIYSTYEMYQEPMTQWEQ